MVACNFHYKLQIQSWNYSSKVTDTFNIRKAMFVLTLDHSLIIGWQGARVYKKEEKDKDWKKLNIEKQPFRQKRDVQQCIFVANYLK